MAKGQRRFTKADEYCVDTALCRHGPRHGEQGPIIIAAITDHGSRPAWSRGAVSEPQAGHFAAAPRAVCHSLAANTAAAMPLSKLVLVPGPWLCHATLHYHRALVYRVELRQRQHNEGTRGRHPAGRSDAPV
jgi:hypothetical protein